MVREKVEKGGREKGLGWRSQIAIKRLFDIAVSALLLFAFSPLFFIILFLVRFTMGPPVFFRQPRLGYRGRSFVIYKFRTMTDDRDEQGNLLPDEQRCWKHKVTNVLDQLPRAQRAVAKEMLGKIVNAKSGAKAERRRREFEDGCRSRGYMKAAETLGRDWERMLTFYRYPKEHWVHIRTTNVVESPFAALRLRTDAAER